MFRKNPKTKEWWVDGIVWVFETNNTPRMIKKRFCVRYTDNDIGKSLSIADENSGVMFQVPFDKLYDEIIRSENNENRT